MSGTLPLAALIAAMGLDELRSLVAERRILSPGTVTDPLGLALELLRPDSVAHAVRTTRRESLWALAALSRGHVADAAALTALAQSGLVGLNDSTGAYVSLPEVERWIDEVTEPPTIAPEPAATTPADTSTWYAPALTSVRRAAEVLRTLERKPAKLGRKGDPTVAALKELAEDAHSDQHTIGRLLETLGAAGLLARVPGYGGSLVLVPAQAAQGWLALDYPHRWVALARAATQASAEKIWREAERVGHDLRRVVEQVPHDYPLLPEAELRSLDRLVNTAEDLGLSVAGQLTPAALALLSGDMHGATDIAERDMPPPAPGVYVQPDLSLIVPGPLPSREEAALSAIAETEQIGPAASMRLSPASLERAVRGGFDARAIRELLERLSLTGIPQPLDFLLTELAKGPVGDVAGPGGSREPGGVVTPSSHGEPEQRGPSPASPEERGTTHKQLELEALVERVFAAARDTGHSELSRKLGLAIRDRVTVQVTAVAGSDQRQFTLLPVSLRAGRLRATDQQAGVERTLPLDAITAVDAVH